MENATMDITVAKRELEPCCIALDVEVPAGLVNEAYKKAIGSFGKNIKVPGFRQGKTPKALIKKRFAKEIRDEATQQLLQDSVRKAVQSEKLDPQTAPRLDDEENINSTEGENFVFTVTFDVKPEFELPKYKEIPVKVKASAVTDEDVDNVINNWLKGRAKVEEVDKPASEGDLIQANYEGTLTEEAELSAAAKSILKAENGWLALREPEVLPGAAKQLEGIAVDETREITVEFPEDYSEESLRGKSANFTVKALKVHSQIMPELDDEMAKQMGSDNVEQLRERVTEQLKQQAEQEKSQAVNREVTEVLLNQVDFALPPRKLQMEKYELAQQVFQQELQRSNNPEEVESRQKELLERADEMAVSRLKREILFEAIADKENISVEKEEIDSSIQMISYYQRKKPEEIRKTLIQNGRLMDLISDLRINKAISFIAENAVVTEE